MAVPPIVRSREAEDEDHELLLQRMKAHAFADWPNEAGVRYPTPSFSTFGTGPQFLTPP